MIKLALRSALSDRASEGKVARRRLVGLGQRRGPRTPSPALAGLGVDGRVLVVVGRDDAAAALSFRNLPEVQLIVPGELNAYDVLCNDWIVFTENTLPIDISDDRRFAGRRRPAIKMTPPRVDEQPTKQLRRPPRQLRRRGETSERRDRGRDRRDES